MAEQSGTLEDITNVSREREGDIRHRKRLSTLSEEELAALREAFRLAQEVSDSRGFGHFASLHGFPEPGYCEHDNQLFLPWHRAYLYFFEQALQDLVPGVTLPWWDWTESDEIPEAFSEETDPSGEPNPLFDAPIEAAGGLRGDDWPQRTSRPAERNPTQLPSGGLPTEGEVAFAIDAVNFDDFTFAAENLHNAVHVWVGGEMVDQRFAGWDPLFWAHHTMVDRLWALWQVDNPGDNPRREHLPKGLGYFKDMTVADTLNVTDLGYDYAASELLVVGG
jgi:tyrosinase